MNHDEFKQSLPRGPLVAHLESLHAILEHVGAEGDVLAVAEHHLRQIAVYTQADDRYGKPELVWECGPHANAWNGHDARCRLVPAT